VKSDNLALKTEQMVVDYPRRALWLSLGILGALTTVIARMRGVAHHAKSIR